MVWWAMGYRMLLVMRFNDDDGIDILILVGTQVLVFTFRGGIPRVVMVVVVVMASMRDV